MFLLTLQTGLGGQWRMAPGGEDLHHGFIRDLHIHYITLDDVVLDALHYIRYTKLHYVTLHYKILAYV